MVFELAIVSLVEQAGPVDVICAKAATSGIADQWSFINGTQGGYGGVGTTGQGHSTRPASRVAPYEDASHSVVATNLISFMGLR